MQQKKVDQWAHKFAEECRLLSAEELEPILKQAATQLIREATGYEPIGDTGSVYRRVPAHAG